MKFQKISDPGHGWLKVPVHLIKFLGIHEKITPYSYVNQSGRFAYLEEDCDMWKFAEACEKHHIVFEYIHKIVNSTSIRNMDSYRTIQISSKAA